MVYKTAISALAAAMLLTSAVPAMAMPRGNGLPVIKTDSVQLVGHRQARRHFRHRNYRHPGFRHGRHWRGHYRGRYPYYRHRHRHDGAAIVAGIIGLAALAAIASSSRRHAYYDDGYYYDAPAYGYRSGSDAWKAACARKYRSFEWHTGLYTTYRGYKRRCRLP
jgi:hypothetical protein